MNTDRLCHPEAGSRYRLRTRIRLAAARVWLALGARRSEIARLSALSAAAFERPPPTPLPRSAKALLLDYARSTRRWAEDALDRGVDLGALDGRLYAAASDLGASYRRALGLSGSACEVMAAARLVYRALGIDFSGRPDGTVEVRRCSFAATYTPRVCALLSALDRGLLAGLSGGGRLVFTRRMTEGAKACEARLERGSA